jgi:chaperonin GroES
MYSAEIKDLDFERLKKSKTFPKPTGYKLLIAMPALEEKTEGGIFIPDAMKEAESTASVVGLVVMMGDMAYQDEDKFPTGPYCKESEWVIFRSYSGTRFKVEGQEFRLINDDTVEAVVTDPRGVKRV